MLGQKCGINEMVEPIFVSLWNELHLQKEKCGQNGIYVVSDQKCNWKDDLHIVLSPTS